MSSSKRFEFSDTDDGNGAQPLLPVAKSEHPVEFRDFLSKFTEIIGDEIPCRSPNVRPGHESEDLHLEINADRTQTSSCVKSLSCFLCCFPLCRTHLIERDEFGFSIHNGAVEFL